MHFKHLNSETKQNKGNALARVKGDGSLEGSKAVLGEQIYAGLLLQLPRTLLLSSS